MRKFLLNIHLSLALGVGIIFAVQGLSGSLIIFYAELDRFLNPHLHTVTPAQPRQSLEDLMGMIREAHPSRTGSWKLLLSTDPQAPLRADYPKPVEKEGAFWAPLMLSINPYSGEILGTRFWGDTLMTWIYDVHAVLQMDKFGWDLVGYMALALLCSLGTGLYLWSTRKWRTRPTRWFKAHSSKSHVLFDLHRLIGLCVSIPLIILALSGFYFVHPTLVKPIVNQISPIRELPKDLQSHIIPAQESITIDQAVDIALKHFPQGEVRKIVTPNGQQGTYEVNVWQPGNMSQRHPLSVIWLDRYSGELLATFDKQDNNVGETVLDLFWPLHREIQEFLGMPGQILYFLVGLAPSVLLVTGLIFYRKKRTSVKRLQSQKPNALLQISDSR